MSSELVEELRKASSLPTPLIGAPIMRDAADRIVSQTGKIKLLRGALREAAETLEWASRRMKGNCSGADVNAVILAARRAREGGNVDG